VISGLSLAEERVTHKETVKALDYLEIMPGIKCSELGCGGVYRNRSTFKRQHQNERIDHKAVNCSLQEVFKNIYWPVEAPMDVFSKNESMLVVKNVIDKAFSASVAHLQDHTARVPFDKRNESGLPKALGWTDIVKGRDLDIIWNLVRLPEEDSDESHLLRLVNAVEAYMRTLYPLLTIVPPLIRQIINTEDHKYANIDNIIHMLIFYSL
jgi:hypothetical protein